MPRKRLPDAFLANIFLRFILFKDPPLQNTALIEPYAERTFRIVLYWTRGLIRIPI